ncbi:MAG: trigger factor [Defluviitaleaceae bacterium]|nr:trigger factor [Defluviitaleaceae bacterium]
MSKKSKTKQPQFSSTYEVVETNKIKLTITITPEGFREGLQKAYNKNKHYFDLPGFRKGKAPRKMIEQMYGKDVFHEDAINFVLPDAYEESLEQHNLDPVYKPNSIEPGDMSEAEGAIFYVHVYVRPEASIDGYYGLTYPKMETEATQADIQDALTTEQEKNARQASVERPAQLKDIVTINFKGFVDGEAFEGGTAEDFNLTLGSGQFIPGFEDQLVGKEVGDDVKVEVTFPEEYGHETLAGKPAVFEVEILDIQAKELPEIDDDFADQVSEFDNLAAYKDHLAKTITERKTNQLDSNKRMHLVGLLVKLTEVDVPQDMYTARLDESWDSFCRQVQMQGMDVETYLRFSNLTEETMRASWAEQAKFDVDSQLALEAVAKKENMTISDEEFRNHLKEMMGGEEKPVDDFIEKITPARRRDLERDLLCKKALDLVAENAIAVDEPETPVVPIKNTTDDNIIEGEAKELPNEEE